MSGPKLLVSVRSVAEAQVALRVGVDLLDIKEPRQGSLGAANIGTIRQIAEFVANRVPVSVALGELIDENFALAGALPQSVAYAKVGLAGCADAADWPARWRRLISVLPHHVKPVAVVYADRAAHAPAPQQIVAHANQANCAAVLVDTFDKSAGGLLDHWPDHTVGQFVAQVRAAGMMCVLAGSVSLDALPQLLPLFPHYIAVRGAVCDTHRTSTLDAGLLHSFRAELTCPDRKIAGV